MTEAIRANLPVLVVIAPLFIAFILPTLARRMRLVEGLVILVQTLVLLGAGYLVFVVFLKMNKGIPITYQLGGWPAPWGIELKAGSLGAFFLLVIVCVSLPIVLFAKGNLEEEVGGKGRVARFYTLFLLLCGALIGMAMTNDMFNVYVLVEVATISCCGLVSSRNHPRATEAAFTYLILATLGAAFVLGGIGFLYIVTGHLNMSFASQELAIVWQNHPHIVWLAASFLVIGFGVKAALFPLHVWLPDAHSSAPSPASAILSGLAVKGYLICLLKFLYTVFGQTLMKNFTVHRILVLAGTIAIIAGSILALKQNELKRRLAYSTVAQMGYIFLGLGLLNTKGLTGMLFYLASHAVIKSVLFLAAGAIIDATGKADISEMAGIGRKMPITMAAFTISSLGLIGIPMFSGFVGKWNLLIGSLETGNLIPAAVIIIGSILCAAYLLPVIRIAYFDQAPQKDRQTPQKDWRAPQNDRQVLQNDRQMSQKDWQTPQKDQQTSLKDWQVPQKDWHDPGLSQKAALVLLSAAVIILGVIPGPLLELAGKAAAELLMLQ